MVTIMDTGGTVLYGAPLLSLSACFANEDLKLTVNRCELQTAYAIKWAVIVAILVAVFIYFIGGYMHARRRMSKGLPPLAYHRVRIQSSLSPFSAVVLLLLQKTMDRRADHKLDSGSCPDARK